MQNTSSNKFTSHLRRSIEESTILASRYGASHITLLYALWGMTLQRGSIGSELLAKHHVQAEDIHDWVHRKLYQPTAIEGQPSPLFVGQEPTMSTSVKTAITRAASLANTYHHRYIGTEHFLYSLCTTAVATNTETGEEAFRSFIQDTRLPAKRIIDELTAILKTTSRFPDLTESVHGIAEPSGLADESALAPSVIEQFTVDLTAQAQQHRIDPLIGRTYEVDRVMNILNRRTKNNPLLIGEAGVGKTAIVEGLAVRIIEGDVPAAMLKKRILSLNMATLVAGSIFRGEFEGRLKQLVEEITRLDNIILFIDELHTIVGAGSASGSLDAANMLKPALARGAIRCIGACTFEDYRKYIEKDPALERRFQPVRVNEPTPEESIAILAGLKETYEHYHGVTITPEAIRSAVELSVRYMPDRQLPDKAIDLLDEASSRLYLANAPTRIGKKLRSLTNALDEQLHQKAQAVNEERFADAMTINTIVGDLKQQITSIEERLNRKDHPNRSLKVLSHHIVDAVSRMKHIPSQEILGSDTVLLRELEERLNQEIIGQQRAITSIVQTAKRARLGIGDPHRPVASMLLLGPSGVGKTQTAKALAHALYGGNGSDHLIRLDMSEYAEGYSISKLIGSPAGYVGYRESGTLTESMRRNPYSLVLLDEIEKAHRDIYNLLLQILDDGILTDSTGRSVSFQQSMIILTSNIGSNRYTNHPIGFGRGQQSSPETHHDIRNDLRNHFPIEFLNRIDTIVIFDPLSRDNLEQIARREIRRTTERLKHRVPMFTVDPALVEYVLDHARTEEGARGIRRAVEELLTNPLVDYVIRHDTPPSSVHASVKHNAIVFE